MTEAVLDLSEPETYVVNGSDGEKTGLWDQWPFVGKTPWWDIDGE